MTQRQYSAPSGSSAVLLCMLGWGFVIPSVVVAKEGVRGGLTIAGNDAVQDCQERLLRRFAEARPGLTTKYLFGGDWRGVRELVDGNVDVAIVSGDGLLMQKELDSLGKAFPDSAAKPRSVLAGYVGVVFVLHKSNAVTAITYQQAKDIVTGKIQQWSAVSGGAGRIQVCGLRPWTIPGYCLDAHLGSTKGKTTWRDDITWERNSSRVVARVAQNGGMLGFVAYDGKRPDLTSVKIVGINKNGATVMPTRETIAAEEYPFIYSVRFLVRPGTSGLPLEYVQYAVGNEEAVKIWERIITVRP